jgi:PBP1b-binding outer membrane lipoprotein LpoB
MMRINLLSALCLAFILAGCAGGDLQQAATTTQTRNPAVSTKAAPLTLAATSQKQSLQKLPEADPLVMSQR